MKTVYLLYEHHVDLEVYDTLQAVFMAKPTVQALIRVLKENRPELSGDDLMVIAPTLLHQDEGKLMWIDDYGFSLCTQGVSSAR